MSTRATPQKCKYLPLFIYNILTIMNNKYVKHLRLKPKYETVTPQKSSHTTKQLYTY